MARIGNLERGLVGFMLPHEQFPVPQLVEIGAAAAASGFGLLAASDHFQPWQANQGHSGLAWVTLAAAANRVNGAWMGTTVTCPTLRYNPAVVAEAFASLSLLSPGRIFLGLGSGEALNELAATGEWPDWEERWERLIEAIEIIRALWTGETVNHNGKYYTVRAKLFDPPEQPIPLLVAANGPKSLRMAAKYGDGLITDPKHWRSHKADWEQAAREAGKDPAKMPVLVEHFVVVGDREEAKRWAELWRFLPKGFEGLYELADPAAIQQRAERDVPLDDVLSSWTVGTDPQRHADAVRDLFESGATIVNVHAGQDDQRKAIEFYGSEVLPKLQCESSIR
jgi:F420-dependent hydroxymycolic acid dehydrogenase